MTHESRGPDRLSTSPRRTMLCKAMPTVKCPRCGKSQPTAGAPLGRNFNQLGQPGTQRTSGMWGAGWESCDDNWVPVCSDERCRHWLYLPVLQTTEGVPDLVMRRVMQIYHLTEGDSAAAMAAFEDLRARGWKEEDEQ